MIIRVVFSENVLKTAHKALSSSAFAGLRVPPCAAYQQPHAASFSSSTCLTSWKWRLENQLPINQNAYGPLTDGPDFSYLDGRPAPPGMRQIKRLIKHQEMATQIVDYIGQVDFAVERHKQMTEKREAEKQHRISSKLKPKGNEVLNSES